MESWLCSQYFPGESTGYWIWGLLTTGQFFSRSTEFSKSLSENGKSSQASDEFVGVLRFANGVVGLNGAFKFYLLQVFNQSSWASFNVTVTVFKHLVSALSCTWELQLIVDSIGYLILKATLVLSYVVSSTPPVPLWSGHLVILTFAGFCSVEACCVYQNLIACLILL